MATVFELNLSFTISVEGEDSNFPILSSTTVPIPVCNEDASFSLPGDGSIGGFVKALGESFAQTAVDEVLKRLGIKVNLSILTHLWPAVGVKRVSYRTKGLKWRERSQI